MRSKRLAALCAIVAGAVGLAAAHVAAILIDPASSPISVVGEAFINVVPAWLKNIAVAAFGLFDKAALLVGIGLVLAALLGLLGVQALRRPSVTLIGLLALPAVPATLAYLRPDFGALNVVPSLICGLVACLAFAALFARFPRDSPSVPGAPRAGRDSPSAAEGTSTAGGEASEAAVRATQRPPEPESFTPATRRRFLTTLGVTAVAAGATAGGAQLLSARSSPVADARRSLSIPRPGQPAPAAPAGVDPPVRGLTPYRTSLEEFYRIDTALTVPRLDPATWRLRVWGEVEDELELTFDELVGGGMVEAWVTLTCVSNLVGGSLAGNAVWTGIPIREVLARVRPLPGADMVLSTSADGWTASTPLDVLTDPGRASLLAVTMNGEPLPLEHGFPVRMVVPGLYGYVSATKWVTELEVTRFSRRVAYWSTRGWSSLGPIKTASRIDVPNSAASVAAGNVVVAGVAWAQHRGIEAVEVQVDDSPWAPAVLAPTVGPDTWRQWTYEWTARRGEHRLRVRATDGDGVRQTAELAPPAPDGATGWHTISVDVT